MSESRARLLRLVETAVMIAAAVALSYVTIWKMPQGGSVTMGSMVPIMLIALRHGTRWGILAGVASGSLQYMIDGKFYYLVQVLLDYPIAFGALGLAGLAYGRSYLAAAWAAPLALTGRFLAHLVAGAVFFGQWAPEGMNPWIYSAGYNASYMLPELVLSGVLLSVLLPVLDRALPTGLTAQHQS